MEYMFEVETNGLQQNIKYVTSATKITDTAEITSDKCITIYENYCQFLWSLCYSTLTIFEEGIKKPQLAGTYDGNFLDYSNGKIKEAALVFMEGFGLLKKYSKNNFYNLPNPINVKEKDRFYVERANGIYLYAMVFVIFHEYSHQFYGHLDTDLDNSHFKKDEIDADNYAFTLLEKNYNEDLKVTYRVGAVITMCSFILMDETLSGGDRHPDPDYRLTELLNQMDLLDIDDLWGIASILIILWANIYDKDLQLDFNYETNKEMYDSIMTKLYRIKNNY